MLAKLLRGRYEVALPYHSGKTGITSTMLVRHATLYDVPPLKNDSIVSNWWAPPAYYQKLSTRNVEIYTTGPCYLSPEGVIVSKSGISERQFIYTSERSTITPFKIMQARTKGAKFITHERVIVLHDRWSVTNYFHWITESLVKLLLVRDRMEYNGVPVIIPEHAAPFVIQSIRLLDPNRPVVMMPSDKLAWVKRSVHVDYSRLSGTHDPEMVRRVADEVLRCAAPFNNKNTEFNALYVSRDDAKCRKITNEKEILSTLNQNKIQLVKLSGMDFIAQINLFRNCNLLIGPHGAGLTNGIFMPPESRVLEITSVGKLQPPALRYCFYSLLSSLNLRYEPILAVSEDENDPEADMYLSEIQLLQMKRAIIQK
jgi:hypothetical protein